MNTHAPGYMHGLLTTPPHVRLLKTYQYHTNLEIYLAITSLTA